MWQNGGIIRTEESLTSLVKTITGLRARLNLCAVENYKDLVKKLELKNMLLVGNAIAKSALIRKESRGAHFRADFADEGGDEWLKSIRFT